MTVILTFFTDVPDQRTNAVNKELNLQSPGYPKSAYA